jgi:DNA-binding CsgD family transcriptional regulator
MPPRHAAYIFSAMTVLPDESAQHGAAAPELLRLLADALAWPLLLLRADGGLLHANRAARDMLQQGRPLRLSPRRQLVPADPQQREALADALREVAASGAGRALHWAEADGVFSATLSRLEAGAPALLLLALARPDGGRGMLDDFAALHGLTAAEAGVLRQLARGASSSRAAAALGVSAATVRSQTASLRRKTGHASVAALLRELATLPPLAGAATAASRRN